MRYHLKLEATWILSPILSDRVKELESFAEGLGNPIAVFFWGGGGLWNWALEFEVKVQQSDATFGTVWGSWVMALKLCSL